MDSKNSKTKSDNEEEQEADGPQATKKTTMTAMNAFAS